MQYRCRRLLASSFGVVTGWTDTWGPWEYVREEAVEGEDDCERP
jgi:hypothetical protein